ncbi:MAG TPA: asparagine synthase (glutamine-hydrolyzing) [Polyangiaceae bacterium]|nr:asparagine synthase (glutamine-hydrolyzing) [Polyangiaceae bacterium]
MCGISGAVGAIDEEIERAVRAMSDAQTHRGPDDSGLFRSEETPGAMFGFRRLSIIDLSADGHQPMLDESSGNAIVFNGEIYNFAELRKQLQAENVSFRSKGDTEALLRGYGRWGTLVLPKLRGMFGFAIYDKQRREVVLARDRLGIKPLYYTVVQRPNGKVLLFASELRALLASGLLAPRLDPAELGSYLWNGFTVGPGTLVRGISLLPAGALLRVSLDAERREIEHYWNLGHRALMPNEQALEALQHELIEAMRQHMVSDVPLGVFLSGGVDSSAIAALAVGTGSGRVKTFHIGFDESKFDESVHARRVAEALGTEHSEFRLTQRHFADQIEPALASLDQPSVDAINTYFVSRAVREAGLTVALAGTGGDELFGGYRTFRDLPRGQRLGKLAGPAASPVAAVMRAALGFGKHDSVPPQTRWGKLADALDSDADPVALYQVFYALFTRQFLSELAAPELLENTEDGLPKGHAKALRTAIAGATPLSATSVLELALFVGERLLRDTDSASMAVSLEVRVPLLDHAVVEAALAVPDGARFMPLGKKRLLKQMGMPQLDPSIFERPKAGFVLPIEVWAKDKLAGDIEQVFADRALVESVGLRPAALDRLWRAFRAGAPGIYWSRIWAPYVLLRWCREHSITLG